MVYVGESSQRGCCFKSLGGAMKQVSGRKHWIGDFFTELWSMFMAGIVGFLSTNYPEGSDSVLSNPVIKLQPKKFHKNLLRPILQDNILKILKFASSSVGSFVLCRKPLEFPLNFSLFGENSEGDIFGFSV